jgi:hypothetical protein
MKGNRTASTSQLAQKSSAEGLWQPRPAQCPITLTAPCLTARRRFREAGERENGSRPRPFELNGVHFVPVLSTSFRPRRNSHNVTPIMPSHPIKRTTSAISVS